MGAARYANRLTKDSVVVIKGMLLDGIPMQTIARAFGVSYQSINNIYHGRTWSHVKVER